MQGYREGYRTAYTCFIFSEIKGELALSDAIRAKKPVRGSGEGLFKEGHLKLRFED